VAETALAAWLLAAAGLDAPPGPLTVLPDPVPPSSIEGGRLTHRADRVPWGRAAPFAVFVTSREDAAEVGLVATSAASATAGCNLAREPRDALAFEAAPLRAAGATRLPVGILPLLGALVRSAQMAGALRTLLEESVRYAGERIQFGKPIGRFQVIQHELARLAGHTAAAEVAAEAAFAALDRAAPAPRSWKSEVDPSFEIAVAKVRAGEAAEAAPSIAHQVHGAIGFSYEHALHFSSRRLWAWRSEFGSENHWAGRLGRTALALGAEGLWPFLTSR
jgi:acyl-CoA dehydrogenase